MARDVIALGPFDDAAQGRIGFRVGHAILGDYVQLSAVFGKELRFLSRGLEDRLFALFEDPSHWKLCLFIFPDGAKPQVVSSHHSREKSFRLQLNRRRQMGGLIDVRAAPAAQAAPRST